MNGTGTYPHVIQALPRVWEDEEGVPLAPLNIKPFPRYGGVRLANGHSYVFVGEGREGEWGRTLQEALRDEGRLRYNDDNYDWNINPAGLAYDILLYHGAGEIDPAVYATDYYRAFAEDVVSKFDPEWWVVEGHVIERWLNLRQGRMEAA